MSPQFASLLLPCLLTLVQSGQTPARTPTTQEIDAAVRQLGDDGYGVRQRASDFLWQAGKAAEPALWKATESGDAEVVARARRILRRFQYGVYHDTPAEVLALIGQFRFGSRTARLNALKRLRDMEQMSTLLLLLKREPDEGTRKQLAGSLLKDVDQFAGRMFIEGNWEKAEQLLQLGAISEAGIRNYAAYLLLRNQLDAAIAKQKDRVARGPQTLDWQLIVYLLRAKGDLPAARSMAEKAADDALTGNLLIELGDWPQLAASHDKLGRDAQGVLAGGIVHLGYAAAYHRLAGDAKGLEEAVAGIRRLAAAKPNKVKYCGEALLINGRFQDAIEMFGRQDATLAFEVLSAQHRFREALALAGIDDPGGPYSPWFADSPPAAESTQTQKRDRFVIGMYVATALHGLGESRRSIRLFAELAEAAENDNSFSLSAICKAEYELGLSEQAIEHAAMALSKERNEPVFRALFPEHDKVAEMWWKFLRQKCPHEPPAATMRRLHELLRPA